MRRTAFLTSVLLLACAAPAAAQAPPPPAPAPAPPAPVPTPPAAGTLSIGLEQIGGTRATILAGDRFRVRGTVTPYVAGQRVVVRLYRGARKIQTRTVTVKPVGGRGAFVLGLQSRGTGRAIVRASHAATPELASLQATPKGVDVLPTHVDGSSSAGAVRALQRRLSAVGYVVGEPGRYDARTARAVLAFRKVTGMDRTSVASEPVLRSLAAGHGAFPVRFPKHGRHVEADLSLQVVALIDQGKVQRIYPTSSGKPSTPTILGTFSVYLKTPGTNAKGMVFTDYFRGGYGIHGYAEVPVYPASHGCLRVPVPDAVTIYNWLRYGDVVDVYL
jgi:lipoprotein-anchoring transpeptidase ErfK/SrfK